jgi:N-acetyltransferase
MNWIQHPVVLEGSKVQLVPLEDKHFDALIAMSSVAEIWEHLSIPANDPGQLSSTLKSAVLNRMMGSEYPFVILEKQTGKVIGCTRYMDMSKEHRKLEIGWTWNHPGYWQKGYNTEAKLLLLTYAFETLGCVRVQLKTRDANQRSRNAILKIGATFEGIMRKERIRFDGPRNTAVFSIIDDEWTVVKNMLQEKVSRNYENISSN